MYGQSIGNPQEIARVAEQSVVALKNLETQLDVLRNDLAALCLNLGHVQAAQFAIAPTRSAAFGIPTGFGAASAFGPYTGFQPGIPSLAGVNPFAQTPVAPWQSPYYNLAALYQSPGYYPGSISPLVNPQAFNPYLTPTLR